MPNREAPLRHVPRVFAEDAVGYSRPAKCVHCGHVISKREMTWSRLDSDPAGMARPVHIRCDNEYSLFAMALNL